MVNRRERGSVQRTIRRLAMVIRSEHTPGPSSHETKMTLTIETTKFDINL